MTEVGGKGEGPVESPRPDSWLEESRFDAIVVGQELPASVLAAAVARSGRSVLHIDANDFYGGSSATLDLPSMDRLFRVPATREVTGDHVDGADKPVRGGAGLGFDVECGADVFVRGSQVWPESPQVNGPSENDNTNGEERKEDVLREGDHAEDNSNTEAGKSEEETHFLEAEIARRIQLDAGGRFFFATGALIDLLVQSTVAKYLDFKLVDAAYLWQESAPRLVPGSRADVFRNKYISLIEKRILTKFMGFIRTALMPDDADDAADATENPQLEGRTFDELLGDHRLTPKLREFVLYAIALLRRGDESAVVGMEELALFVRSLGRFDTHTPFISLMYGIGELVQAFARLSAVFGCLCILRRDVLEVLRSSGPDDNSQDVRVRDSEGQELSARLIAFSASTAPRSWTRVARTTAHASLVCRGPVLREELESTGTSADTTNKTGNALLVLPPNAIEIDGERNGSAIHVLQFGDEMGTSPHGIFTLHMTMVGDAGASGESMKALLRTAADAIRGESTEAYLYEAYWVCREREGVSKAIPRGYAVLDDMNGSQIHLEACVAQPRALFASVFGDSEEFLPPAPAPEDIVWEAEEQVQEDSPVSPPDAVETGPEDGTGESVESEQPGGEGPSEPPMQGEAPQG